jgi:DNA invertase Pin-like site-specific DNA recombinase
MGAFAKFEREMICERVVAGRPKYAALTVARRYVDPAAIFIRARVAELLEQGVIARELGVPVTTARRATERTPKLPAERIERQQAKMRP